jgi:hypothetical protein
MSVTKLSAIAALAMISTTLFASGTETERSSMRGYKADTQCPPSSALQHAGAGQAWILDAPYNNDWTVVQDPMNSWKEIKSLPRNTLLTVTTQEGSIVLGNKMGNKFKTSGFATTICTYKYAPTVIDEQKWIYDDNEVRLISAYAADPVTSLNHVVNGDANFNEYGKYNQYGCHTAGDNPGACPIGYFDSSKNPFTAK